MIDTSMAADLYEGEFIDRYHEIDGRKLHYTEWNPGGDQLVVLLHGLNVQCHTWDPLAHALQDEYRVICPDLRGHGRSDWTQEGYWTKQFVSDLKSLVDSQAKTSFALVGHSLGARIAIAYAGEHPSDVTHLALSDTGPETPASTAKSVGNFIANSNSQHGFRNEDEVLDFYAAAHPEWKPIFHLLHVKYQTRKNWAGKFVLRADPDMYWIMRGAGLKEVPYLWEMTEKISAPTLIMHGEESPFFNDEIIGRMEALIPETEVVRFKTGHYIPREDPDAFCLALRAFLGDGRSA